MDDIRVLLPKDKMDENSAETVIALGYPAVQPLLPELLQWLQDYNWPVAQALAPFIATIGLPLVPYLRDILMTTDDEWKYWVMTKIIRNSSEIITALQAELERIAENPTPSERSDELDTLAQDILQNN